MLPKLWEWPRRIDLWDGRLNCSGLVAETRLIRRTPLCLTAPSIAPAPSGSVLARLRRSSGPGEMPLPCRPRHIPPPGRRPDTARPESALHHRMSHPKCRQRCATSVGGSSSGAGAYPRSPRTLGPLQECPSWSESLQPTPPNGGRI